MKSIVSLPSSDLALSFSGCGFLASYHFGVAICFRKHAKNLLSRTRYFCGSSAGALVGAMLLLSPNTLEDGLSQLVLLANEINSYKFGALSPGVNLSERLLSIIEQNIPSDISVAQDRLLLSLTRTRDYSNTIISKFENRQHLIECLNATCFVPVYSDAFSKPPVIQGETFIDGACTNNLPTVRNVPTVTVSPFSGSALITPEDNNLFDWKMCISNQIMNVNMQNVVRGAQALFPPSEEKLMDYYGAGFRDAMRFLLEKRWFEREFGTEESSRVGIYQDFRFYDHQVIIFKAMQLTSLSSLPNQPSILVELPNTTILLDCALSFDSLASFLPIPIIHSNRFSWTKKILPYGKGAIPILKQINEFTFVEEVPELRPILLGDVDVSVIDAIFISNLNSMLALPFITERTNFRGDVFATDPIVQFGRILMEELLEMFECIDRPSRESSYPWKAISRSFRNPPNSDPMTWAVPFTREELERTLRRVKIVYFRQEICVNGELTMSAYSSGYSIGACNWIISSEVAKVAYMASSSLRPAHAKSLDLSPLRDLDFLILTSLSTTPDEESREEIDKFLRELINTLRRGGNVLLPVQPTGRIYDLFELVLNAISNESSGLPQDTPIFFVSPIAETSLAFANIYSEWLSDEKSERVNKPEEPFFHNELIRSGRIRVYENLHGSFSREFRTPCVLFTSHPSLRFGSVVHFMDLWGGESRNALIMTDPDFPLETYYLPYRTLNIRAYYFPIDNRLNYTHVSTMLANNIKTKHVITLNNIDGTKLKIPTSVKHQTADENCPILIADQCNKKVRKRVHVDSQVLEQIEIKGHKNASDVGICTIDGVLSAYDNNIRIKKRKISDVNTNTRPTPEFLECDQRHPDPQIQIIDLAQSCDSNQKLVMGRLESNTLVKYLENEKELGKIELVKTKQLPGSQIVKIPAISAQITITNEGRRSNIKCPSEKHRSALKAAIHSCLTEL